MDEVTLEVSPIIASFSLWNGLLTLSPPLAPTPLRVTSDGALYPQGVT